MVRRACLKCIIGIVSFSFFVGDWLGRGVEAQPPRPAPAGPTPRSVAEAVQSRRADVVAAFIRANPAVAAAASPKEKAEMLTLMGDGARCCGNNPNWGVPTPPGVRAEYERASLTLLRGVDRRPNELGEIVRHLGGPATIEATIPRIENAELRGMAVSATRR